MLRFYNTLTREKEVFKPEGKTVTMYSCGPTVYNYAHIGNLRTYVFMDLVRRTLKYDGYKLKGVMNITDVGHLMSDGDEGEDKMEVAAKKQRKSPYEIAAYYTDVIFQRYRRAQHRKTGNNRKGYRSHSGHDQVCGNANGKGIRIRDQRRHLL